MSQKSRQAPSAVVMIRPHHFSVNTETALDNHFQSQAPFSENHKQLAHAEITDVAAQLQAQGVKVHLFEDTGTDTPDSVFPNNWFSTHAGGHIALYPMKASNRRPERRRDILEFLKQHYRVQDIIDYSGLEYDQIYLEGTGAMVLDHLERIAYAVESERTNPILLERFCTHFNFEPMVFQAVDESQAPIYHTNVLMCLGTDFALMGTDMIPDQRRRDEIINRLTETGRDVISLSSAQISQFAGNALELQGTDGRLLALSQTAFDALSADQKARIEKSAFLLPLSIPTIELAGGSIRCTLAGIHLSPR